MTSSPARQVTESGSIDLTERQILDPCGIHLIKAHVESVEAASFDVRVDQMIRLDQIMIKDVFILSLYKLKQDGRHELSRSDT